MQVHLDNAAFEDNEGWELARILRRLAENIDHRNVLPHNDHVIPLRDSFGNTVGNYFCKEDEGDQE
jgi:hypothetical protein